MLSVGLALSIASLLISLSLPRQSLEEHLESTRSAKITGSEPEEVQMKREAELAGKDFEDVVAAAAAANPSDRSTVKDTARTTVEAAVEPTVEAIVQTTKKERSPRPLHSAKSRQMRDKVRLDKGLPVHSSHPVQNLAHSEVSVRPVHCEFSSLHTVRLQAITLLLLRALRNSFPRHRSAPALPSSARSKRLPARSSSVLRSRARRVGARLVRRLRACQRG